MAYIIGADAQQDSARNRVVTHFGGSVTTGWDKSGEDSSLCSSMKALSRWL